MGYALKVVKKAAKEQFFSLLNLAYILKLVCIWRILD